MKRIIASLLIVVFVLSFMLIPASAEQVNPLDTTGVITTDEIQPHQQAADEIEENDQFVNVERVLPLVVDNAGVLTEEEENYLLQKCLSFTDDNKAEIAIVTITDLDGKTIKEYADDFYDYNGYGYGKNKDGLLCVFLPGEEGSRKAGITTYGSAKRNIGDDEIEDMLFSFADFAKIGEYEDAFDCFISMSEDAIKPASSIPGFVICLAIGIVAGLVITHATASANKSVRMKDNASDYVRQGTLKITGSNDIFRTSRVNVTPKPKNNSGKSSGSGSTHRSSSGRSHGGGSISF